MSIKKTVKNKQRSPISLRLKSWRKSLGLNQQGLSDLTGIPKSTLQGYELSIRAPGSEHLITLSGHGLDINWLLTGKETKVAKPTQEMDDALHVICKEIQKNATKIVGAGLADSKYPISPNGMETLYSGVLCVLANDVVSRISGLLGDHLVICRIEDLKIKKEQDNVD